MASLHSRAVRSNRLFAFASKRRFHVRREKVSVKQEFRAIGWTGSVLFGGIFLLNLAFTADLEVEAGAVKACNIHAF